MIQPYLISDGSSDAVLGSILDWLLAQHLRRIEVNRTNWMDFRDLQRPPVTLTDKIRFVVHARHVDLLFIHRDAEKQPRQLRLDEIRTSIQSAREKLSIPPSVCVIPVRMTEAWLLFNEIAIRRAVDNPNGKVKLNIPSLTQLEDLPNPKQVLYDLLKTASELSGRKLESFKPEIQLHRIPDYITDYSPLLKLSAFAALEHELRELITAQGWNKPD